MYDAVHASPEAFPVALPDPSSRRFRSRDAEEVRNYVGQMFCDHSLELVNARSALNTRVAHVSCGAVTLSEMEYGADVMIDAGQLQHFYLVQIPVSGKARDTLGGRQGSYAPGTASVQHPVAPLQMYWSADCRKVVLRYERAAFERFVELFLGKPLRNPLLFAPSLDLSSFAGRMLVDQVQSALGVLRQGAALGPGGGPPLLESHLETCLMAALAFLQPHDQADAFTRVDSGSEPQPVRRVREYLEAHAHEPVDMAVLGAVAGIPVRTLHHQFRRALGQSPMQLLRDIRLDRVRRELLQAGPGANVTQIALQWGFDHLGRFAATYRDRFGEAPRETLHRQRQPRA